MKLTIYEPAIPVEIEITFPAFRQWNSVRYMILDETKCISVRCTEDGIGSPCIESMNFLATHATCAESITIPATTFFELYATARQQLDDLTGIEMHQLKQEAYHDDLIQDRQEAAEERKSMYEKY